MLLFQYMYNIIYKYNVRYGYFIFLNNTYVHASGNIHYTIYIISIHMPYQYIQCLNSFKACNVNYTINLTTLSNSDLSSRVCLFLCINKASDNLRLLVFCCISRM